MRLQFILGRAGSGKSSYMMQQIKEQLLRDPYQKIILLAPEQSTFYLESQLIFELGLEGLCSLQVLSFERLAWYLFQETGNASKIQLDALGRLMLLRKIIQEDEKDLPFTKGALRHPGYLNAISETLSDLIRNGSDTQSLCQYLDQNHASSILHLKASEMDHIYRKYSQIVNESQWLDQDHILTQMAASIKGSRFMKDAIVCADGFDYFSMQHLQVFQQLMENGNDITITLTYIEQDFHMQGVFAQQEKTYRNLCTIAQQASANILPNIVMEENYRFHQAKDLAYLEKAYFQPYAQIFDQAADHIELLECTNPHMEVESAAIIIRKLCREKGYRYRDIAIFVRNIREYQSDMETVFTDYDIPYFCDTEQMIYTHPLIELIGAVFEIKAKNWATPSVLRYLKTAFVLTDQDSVDKLETYILACGIQHSQWYREDDWQWRGYYNDWEEGKQEKWTEADLEELNSSKKRITEPLVAFYKKIGKKSSVKEMIAALYSLLAHLNVVQTLEKWQQEAIERGDFLLSQVHQQIWNKLMDILDQISLIAEEEVFSPADFSQILSSALNNMTLSMIPLSMDQVMIGSVSRSRNFHAKVGIILGANEGVFPAKPAMHGIFTEQELAFLEPFGMPTPLQKLYDEQFGVYSALTRAEDRLYISYSLNNASGNALQPSEIITKIEKNLFANIKKVRKDGYLAENTHPVKCLADTVLKLLHHEEATDIDKVYSLYNWYRQSRYKAYLQYLIDSWITLNEREGPIQIHSLLTFNRLHLSISSIEKYRQCPYSYFLHYTLSLKERAVYTLDKMNIGQLYHKAMEELTNKMLQEGEDWNTITDQRIESLSKETISELAPKMQNEILFSSGRYQYMAEKFARILQKSAIHLAEHSRQGDFSTFASEIAFGGSKDSLPGLNITLKDGTKLQLIGRIDRVEKAQGQSNTYLRIVDFKSGNHGLSLDEVYYGLKIQLLTYLLIVLQANDGCIGAGALYHFIQDAMVKANRSDSAEKITKELHKNIRPKGLLLADLEAVSLADKEITRTLKSDILPVSLLKEYEKYRDSDLSDLDSANFFSKNSSVVNKKTFELLENHIQHLIRDTGEAIIAGNMEVEPYHMGEKNGCRYCSYQTICQFSIKNTLHYKELEHMKKEDVLQKIAKEEEEYGMDSKARSSNQ